MAHGGAFPYYESKEYDCSIIGLPYRRNLTTMFVILPNNSNRQRLRQLQATLTADKIQELISKMEWKTAIILFPKLHIVNQLNLQRVLNRMGLRTIFRFGHSDLSLMSSGDEENHMQANSPLLNDAQSVLQSTQRHPGASDNESEQRFLFTRFDENENKTLAATKRNRRSAVTYKVSSSDFHSVREPLRLKDLVLKKRITKSFPRKKVVSRGRRDTQYHSNEDSSLSLKRLDLLRSRLQANPQTNPGLYADELLHKIDLTINEVGTEGGAATAVVMRRTGPDVVFRAETPFLFLIRHDDTKLPIFYGTVFEPTNN